MAIDPIDIIREEAKRADRKREDRAQDTQNKANKKPSETFLAKYQVKMKQNKEDYEQKLRDSEQHKKDPQLLSRIVESIKGQQDKGQDTQKEFNKKEDLKKDQTDQENSFQQTDSKTTSKHERVDAIRSHQQGEGSGGSGGGSGQGGSQSGGGSLSSSMGQSKQQSSQHQQKNFSGQVGESFLKVNRIAASKGSQMGGSGSFTGRFPPKILDEVVESVKLLVNSEGKQEMEIILSDDYFSGIKIKAVSHPNGVVICFVCPNTSVKNLFILNRLQIYSRLKSKNILVSRVDVI